MGAEVSGSEPGEAVRRVFQQVLGALAFLGHDFGDMHRHRGPRTADLGGLFFGVVLERRAAEPGSARRRGAAVVDPRNRDPPEQDRIIGNVLGLIRVGRLRRFTRHAGLLPGCALRRKLPEHRDQVDRRVGQLSLPLGSVVFICEVRRWVAG